jgi:TonB family protein
MAFIRFAILGLTLALSPPTISAQENLQTHVPNAPQNSAETQATNTLPDTAEGLRSLLEHLVAAIQKGDAQETSRITESLTVPNYKTWFAGVFGATVGDGVAGLYAESLKGPAPGLSESLRGVIQDGKTNIRVHRFEAADDSGADFYVRPLMKAMLKPTAVYEANAYKELPGAWQFPGYFFYVDGGFRFVSRYAFRAVPGVLPARIRVGGNVAAAQLIHLVQPIYPLAAKRDHVQGTVVLHAIIGKDGKIAHLEYLGGPLELKQSAMDAVQRWVYKPTLLEGSPVEVDTTVSVIFNFKH